MSNQTEAQLYRDWIVTTVERIFVALDGLSGDDLNWKPPAPETNSLYVLASHMLGNLQENVMFQLGGRPLDRDRDAEFAASGASAAELRGRWEQRRAGVTDVLTRLAPEALDRQYTRPRSGQVLSGRALLLMTAIHVGEHAGHAEMTRDLLRARG
jgi:hypothetical protein